MGEPAIGWDLSKTEVKTLYFEDEWKKLFGALPIHSGAEISDYLSGRFLPR